MVFTKFRSEASQYTFKNQCVTPDGKYLFFNRNTGKVKPTDKYDNIDIFWVDAKVIEDLRSNI